MSTTVANPATLAYKVADMKLADWGRKEISIAEAEMPVRLKSPDAKAHTLTERA